MKGLLFTYAMTYGGAVVSLFNPFVGLLIYICFAIVKPESMWHWSVPAGNYSRIIAIALLAGWALKGFGDWRFGQARGIVTALICFCGWSALSAAFAAQSTLAWNFVEALAKIALPFVVGITVIDSVQKLKTLAWVIMLSQGYVALEFNLSYYAGFNRIQLVGFAGLDNNSVAISMVCGTGLAFFLGLGERRWWAKCLALLAAALMAHAVMFSFSRGGLLSLIICGFFSFVLIRKQPKHYLIFAAAILLGLRLAGPEVISRFATTFADAEQRDASAQSRVDLWWNCLDAMQQRPILGAGPDHWGLIVQGYGWERGKEAHTLWLQTGAELGFPGLCFLLAFYVLSIRGLWNCRNATNGDLWLQDASRMVIASLIAFMVAAQFVTLEGLELPYYVNLLGAGALKLQPRLSQASIWANFQPHPSWAAPV